MNLRIRQIGSCSLAAAITMAAAILPRPSEAAALPVPHPQAERALVASDGSRFTVTSLRLRVPEMRMEKSGREIELAIVRIRRTDAAPGPAHVLLAGGPGDSGVRLAMDLATQGGAKLSEFIDGDIVGIDQRGTGESTPSLRSPLSYQLPVQQAGSVQSWLPLMAKAVREAASDMRARGIRLEAYNTEESADDVAAVLKALGYDRATLWGRSYGSHLALATARRHPAMVERMILVSPEGPDHTWKLPSQIDLVLQRIAERAGTPTMTAQLRDIVRKLEREPVQVSQDENNGAGAQWSAPVSISAFDLQWTIAQVIGDSRALVTLPAALAEMHRGDFHRIAPLVRGLRSRAGVESAMKHMMDLSSGASAERSARIDREAGRSLLGDTINFPGRYLAEAWGARPLNADFHQPVSVDLPVLLIVGDLDARTPLENANEIAASLKHAQVVVVENAAHQFNLFGNPELRSVLGRFTRGEALPAYRVTLPTLKFERPLPLAKEAP